MSHEQQPDHPTKIIVGCLWVVAMWLAVSALVVRLTPW